MVCSVLRTTCRFFFRVEDPWHALNPAIDTNFSICLYYHALALRRSPFFCFPWSLPGLSLGPVFIHLGVNALTGPGCWSREHQSKKR